jgi:hypothetical protein
MVTCEGANHCGLVFFWDPLSSGPKVVDFAERLPGEKVVGKPQSSWLRTEGDSAALFLADSKHYLLASIADSEQPSLPWHGPGNNTWTVGLSTDESPLEIPAVEMAVGPAQDADDDASEMDDTFSYKRT